MTAAIYPKLVLEQDDGSGLGVMLRKYVSIKIYYDVNEPVGSQYYWEQKHPPNAAFYGFPGIYEAAEDAVTYFESKTGLNSIGWLFPDCLIGTENLPPNYP